jgi:hypothetical protein
MCCSLSRLPSWRVRATTSLHLGAQGRAIAHRLSKRSKPAEPLRTGGRRRWLSGTSRVSATLAGSLPGKKGIPGSPAIDPSTQRARQKPSVLGDVDAALTQIGLTTLTAVRSHRLALRLSAFLADAAAHIRGRGAVREVVPTGGGQCGL